MILLVWNQVIALYLVYIWLQLQNVFILLYLLNVVLHHYMPTTFIAVPNLYAFCPFLWVGYVSFGFRPSVNAGLFSELAAWINCYVWIVWRCLTVFSSCSSVIVTSRHIRLITSFKVWSRISFLIILSARKSCPSSDWQVSGEQDWL